MCPTSYDNTQDRNDSMIGNLFYAMIWRKSATLCPEKMPEMEVFVKTPGQKRKGLPREEVRQAFRK
jgi:hypothetical protein